MSEIILVTGGARSGKSKFAEKKVSEMGDDIAYIATAIPFDEGMKNRIKHHKQSRPDEWVTFETPYEVASKLPEIATNCDSYILDCITVLTTNILLKDDNIDWKEIDFEQIDKIEAEVLKEIEKIVRKTKELDLNAIIVTNEIGSGIVPLNRMTRIYRDIAGRANQLIANKADKVYLTVAGIPTKIK